MRSGYTVHIVPSEWRWVITVGSLLIVAAFLPYLLVVRAGATDTQWQFMGLLHAYRSGVVHLAAMVQGAQGDWLTHFIHTPEPHDGVFFDALYTLLGQVSGAIRLPNITLFHLARAAAALFMYMALYQLAASIWTRLRTRRIFFVLVVIGGGLGWLLGPLTNDISYLDLSVPIVYPFQATLIDLHTPFTIGCLALVVSVLVSVLRPGSEDAPGVSNGGVWVFLISLILVFVEPQALVPLVLVLLVLMAVGAVEQRKMPLKEAQWLLWFGVPALPVVAYYVAVLTFNPVAAGIWFDLHDAPPPDLFRMLASFGLLLIIALPGLWRAVRRFEPDGDRFMLTWVLVIVVLLYLPTRASLGFATGLMLPLAYFATRSLEDFWFGFISRRWRYRLLVALVPVLAASHLFVLFVPVRPLTDDDLRDAVGLVLERDYGDAFSWLRPRTRSGDVVLAAPGVGLWLPVQTGARVVYGHPDVTLSSGEKRAAVQAWYALPAGDPACRFLLDGSLSDNGRYTVDYVVVGPQERAFGNAACLEALEPVRTFNSVVIYRYTPGLLDTGG